MWIVYHRSDSPDVGWEMPTENEAKEYCEEHPECRYIWVDVR